MKNFSLINKFSFPIIFVLTDKKIFKQYFVQYPIIFPPISVIFCGKNNAGRKNIHIKLMPAKKKNFKYNTSYHLIKNLN